MPATDLSLLDALLLDWQTQLRHWAASGELSRAAREALLLGEEPELLQALLRQWSAGDFSNLPPVVLLPAANMAGAAGAYAISTGTIYLSQDWLQAASRKQALAVLTEELGHHLDFMLNRSDTPWDEGQEFSNSLTGAEHTETRLYTSHLHNDNGMIFAENAWINAEFSADYQSFTTRTVTIEDLAFLVSATLDGNSILIGGGSSIADTELSQVDVNYGYIGSIGAFASSPTWSQLIPANRGVTISDIEITPAKEIYAFGRSLVGFGTSGSLSGPHYDVTISKYSPAGELSWSRTIGDLNVNWGTPQSAAPDYPAAMAIDAAGNVYITGVTYRVGGTTPTTVSWTDPTGFVVSYTPEGDFRWSTLLDSYVEPRDLALHSNGDVYLTGTAYRDYDRHSFLARLNSANGESSWLRLFGAPPAGGMAAVTPDSGNALAVDQSGMIYVAGTSTNTPVGAIGYIAKFNPEGTSEWSQFLTPGQEISTAKSIAIDSQGKVRIFGEAGSRIDGPYSSWTKDLYSASIDSGGNQVDYSLAETSEDEVAHKLMIGEDGSVFTIGSFFNSLGKLQVVIGSSASNDTKNAVESASFSESNTTRIYVGLLSKQYSVSTDGSTFTIIKRDGSPVLEGQYGAGIVPLAAETVGTINQILWKISSTKVVVWTLDSNWSFLSESSPISIGVDSIPLETEFSVDIDNNGTIGAATITSAFSGNVNIDGLLFPSKWTVGTSDRPLTYGFPQSISDYEDATYPDKDKYQATFSPFTSEQIELAKKWLDLFSSHTNLVTSQFSGNKASKAVVRMALSDYAPLPEQNYANYAHAYLPTERASGGDLWLNNTDFLTLSIGTKSYFALGHELGHALGLKHPQDLPDDNSVVLSADRDSMEFTIMSYNSYIGGPNDGIYQNETGGYAQSLMMYDIAALQHLYGARFSDDNNDSFYTFSESTGEMFINGVGQGRPYENRIFRTIWDDGGIDTYSFLNYKTNLIIDLSPGGWSDLHARGYNQRVVLDDTNRFSYKYASGHVYNALEYQGDSRSLIENADGGSGNDRITGNRVNNYLFGAGGKDALYGREGHDRLDGGLGDDILYGDDGDDIIIGGLGNDSLFGGDGDDRFFGGLGIDKINVGGGNRKEVIFIEHRGSSHYDEITGFGNLAGKLNSRFVLGDLLDQGLSREVQNGIAGLSFDSSSTLADSYFFKGAKKHGGSNGDPTGIYVNTSDGRIYYNDSSLKGSYLIAKVGTGVASVLEFDNFVYGVFEV